MKIRTKVALALTLVFVLCGAALTAALMGMQGARERFDRFLRHDQALLQAANGLYANGLQAGQALRNITLDPGNQTGYRNLEKAMAKLFRNYPPGRKS